MTPLLNAEYPELIPTYEGTNQPTHPSVLHFPGGWHGYKYWMAMTPYPFNNGSYEDPSILASHDGRTWQVPDGVTNPLVPRPAVGHNCDVELVHDPVSNELRLYYVEADDVKQSWVKLLRSSDGVRWIGPEVVLHDPEQMYSILSPTIQRMADGSWQMWYIDAGDTGWNNQCNTVRTRVSPDGLVWGAESPCHDLAQPGYQIWHMTIWREPDRDVLHAFYPAYPDGSNCDYCSLFYAYREPDKPWRVFEQSILDPGAEGTWDDFCIYRASFLLDRTGDDLRLWYGGKKKSDASWRIGLAQTAYTDFIKAL